MAALQIAVDYALQLKQPEVQLDCLSAAMACFGSCP